MKVNREMVIAAALVLLDRVGLEGITLRLLATELKVQAPTLYWHFKNKEELIDEMATIVLARGTPQLLPQLEYSDWTTWISSYGTGLRQVLLSYRDGARMVAATRLTNLEYLKTVEIITGHLIEEGFSHHQAVILIATVYSYTTSLVMEEQAFFPRPGVPSAKYNLAERNARLQKAQLPLWRQAGEILFSDFERTYQEGLNLIVRGASLQLSSGR